VKCRYFLFRESKQEHQIRKIQRGYIVVCMEMPVTTSAAPPPPEVTHGSNVVHKPLNAAQTPRVINYGAQVTTAVHTQIFAIKKLCLLIAIRMFSIHQWAPVAPPVIYGADLTLLRSALSSDLGIFAPLQSVRVALDIQMNQVKQNLQQIDAAQVVAANKHKHSTR